MLLVALTVLSLLAGAGVTAAVSRRQREGWLDQHRCERVLVHTTTDQTWEGSLREVAPDGIVLAAVRLVDTDTALAGDVWVPRDKVLIVQQRVEAP